MLGLGHGITGGGVFDTVFALADLGSLDLHYDFSTLTGSGGDAVSAVTNLGDGGSNYNLSQGTSNNQPTLNTSELYNICGLRNRRYCRYRYFYGR